MENFIKRQASDLQITNFFARFEDKSDFVVYCFGETTTRKEIKNKSKAKHACLSGGFVEFFVAGDLKAKFAHGKLTWENGA